MLLEGFGTPLVISLMDPDPLQLQKTATLQYIIRSFALVPIFVYKINKFACMTNTSICIRNYSVYDDTETLYAELLIIVCNYGKVAVFLIIAEELNSLYQILTMSFNKLLVLFHSTKFVPRKKQKIFKETSFSACFQLF